MRADVSKATGADRYKLDDGRVVDIPDYFPATTISNFDASTQDAAEFGFEQPVRGDGYALTGDIKTLCWRYDVWDDGFHRSCPMSGRGSIHHNAATIKLGTDAITEGNAAAAAKVIAFRQALSRLDV